jgi:hypothetical protein
VQDKQQAQKKPTRSLIIHARPPPLCRSLASVTKFPPVCSLRQLFSP